MFARPGNTSQVDIILTSYIKIHSTRDSMTLRIGKLMRKARQLINGPPSNTPQVLAYYCYPPCKPMLVSINWKNGYRKRTCYRPRDRCHFS